MERRQPEYREPENWKYVEHIFANTPPVTPAAGFVNRWHDLVLLDQKRTRRKKLTILLIFELVTALFFYGVILSQFAQQIVWSEVWLEGVMRLSIFAEFFLSWIKSLPGLLAAVPGMVMLPLWAAVWGTAWGLGLFWLLSNRFSHRRMFS